MKNFLLISSLICAALTCCTKNPSVPEKERRLSVESYARTANGNFKVRDFGMYVMDEDQPYRGIINPVHVTYSGTWVFPEIVLETPASVYAFHPYQSTTDFTSINLSLPPQVDYLATSSAVTATMENPSVQIVMEHILCEVRVTVDGSSDLSFRVKDTDAYAKYNLRTNQIFPREQKSSVSSRGSSIFLFPGRSKPLSMTIYYKGKEYSYSAPVQDYESGKIYVHNLSISDTNSLTIQGGIIVSPWVPGTNYDGTLRE